MLSTDLRKRPDGKHTFVLLDAVGREVWELEFRGDADGFHNAAVIHAGVYELTQRGYTLQGVGPCIGQYYLYQ